MIVCWSTKGGVGTTLVASVIALELGRNAGGAVLADLGGDAATLLGVDIDAGSPGLHQWLTSSSDVPLDATRRLVIDVSPELDLLPPGPDVSVAINPQQPARLSQAFSNLVVDAGVVRDEPGRSLVAAGSQSILVLRACFLGIKRASQSPLRPDGFVLVEESGRSLDARDVEDVLGVPNLATVSWDPAVARLVDAGRMKSRLPRSLKPLQRLVEMKRAS